MNTNGLKMFIDEPPITGARIKVIGVGGGGSNAVNRMIDAGITGVEAARQILLANPSARILMLTMYRQDHYVLNALRAGAAGYLLKDCSEETLFAAIHAVYRGDGWLDTAVTPIVLAQVARDDHPNTSLDSLSETELEILRLLARGAENQAIADQLNLAKSTVANYLRDIFSKLNVNNRTEAALYALRNGLASLDSEDS